MFLSRIASLGAAAAVFLSLGAPARAADTYTEDFESGYTLGQPVGNHADWYGGPTVNAGSGVAGSIGWNYSGTPATWTGVTFDWSNPQFNSYTAGMDFSTNASAQFDDDRVGFSIYNPTTDSSNVMSVQMDPGGSGYNIEGYWDGVGGADKRPSIVNLTGSLAADTWYRLQATFTKTAISNEPIISVDLQGLDGSGTPTGSVASATLDTSTLAAADRPHTKYFSGSVSPAYKNYNHGLADNALAIVDDDTIPPGGVIAHNYFSEQAVGTRNWTPGSGDTELGFATTLVSGTPHTLGVYDSPTSPQRYRMRTCVAEVEMETVDLSLITDATAGIDVMIKDTSWEAGDYFLAVLDNGSGGTLDLAREEGTLGGLPKLSWMHYEASIPDDWTQATMKFSSSTNSSVDAEAVDFDNIEFRAGEEPPPPPPTPENHFTATADPRGNHSGFTSVCQAINSEVDGPGIFHVSAGDIDETIPENRAVIDAQFGAAAVWYPGIGNHEEETSADMQWLRAEYDSGNGVRTPLKDLTNADGPTGTERVCYTWDNPATNTHFIMLNEYWNGGPTEGVGTDISKDDTARDGDIVTALQTWLAADLVANSDKAIFVFGHEPAFPENRHVGDSLDKYTANRDAFWSLLEQHDVVAYMCGHTHYYSKHLGDKDGVGDVWQIDLGNAGNDPGDGMTFVDVVILDDEVRFDVYKSPGGWQVVDSWTVTANCHRVFLGDANLDGMVDIQDFFILKAHFDQDPAAWADGNFNDDTMVDIQDFFILKAHFDEGGGLQPAPEPSTMMLVGLGTLALLRKRRR